MPLNLPTIFCLWSASVTLLMLQLPLTLLSPNTTESHTGINCMSCMPTSQAQLSIGGIPARNMTSQVALQRA